MTATLECCWCLLHGTWAGSCLRVSVLWLSLPPSPQGICTLSNSLSPAPQLLHRLRGGNLGHHHRRVSASDKRSMLQWPGAHSSGGWWPETIQRPDTWLRGKLQVLDRASLNWCQPDTKRCHVTPLLITKWAQQAGFNWSSDTSLGSTGGNGPI